MSAHENAAGRMLVASVMRSKNPAVEVLAKVVAHTLQAAGFSPVRSIVVKSERQHIQQLILHTANDNVADAIVMVGGTGIGRDDDTCEAIDSFVDHRIEGFGEAYRRLLEKDLGAHALLARATAGVYNQCLVFAMTGREAEVKRAIEMLLLPTLPQALELATGQTHSR